jgi:hypothetical protein
MTRAEIAEMAEEGNYEVIFFDGFDDAVVGLVTRFGIPSPVVAYDYEKVIEIIMKDGGTREEAEEHFAFNIIGAWVGDATPVFLTR